MGRLGPMPRSSDARTRFVDTAAGLFQRHGYHGVGLSQIISVSGAPKGSFYHHFPGGKEELAEHTVRHAGAVIAKAIDEAFLEAASFAEGARALADRIADWFEASDWSDGCPITSIVLDTTPTSERILQATQEVFEGWLVRAAGHAERLGAEGDPRTTATRLLVALEGAWIVARVQRSREPFAQAAALVAEG